MVSTETLAVSRLLEDDLNWLESHCRNRFEFASHQSHLRLAASLTRNVITPAILGSQKVAIHVAVVGGAGTGKSTVTNFLCGSNVAVANPQAGYTRHSTAFVTSKNSTVSSLFEGIFGPLRRLTANVPSSLDEDVFQVQEYQPPALDDPINEYVVWDCPDMTTWASENYVSRLLETIGLADVVFFVASDERYNDTIPTQFLKLIVEAGKSVICCLTKVREADAPILCQHFRDQVLKQLPLSVSEIEQIPLVVLPNISYELRSDPAGKAIQHRMVLLNQLLSVSSYPEETHKRTTANALIYLESASQNLLEVARIDLKEIDTWRKLVNAGKAVFEERYLQEFLSSEHFSRVDQSRDEILELFDLTGPGRFVSQFFKFLRLPYQYARDFSINALATPVTPNASERSICNDAERAWIDMLQTEAIRRGTTHPFWKQVISQFENQIRIPAQKHFSEVFRVFESKEIDEVESATHSLPEKLKSNPVMLNTLRMFIHVIDILVIGLIVWVLWPPNLWLLLLIPLSVSFTRQILELVVRALVNHRKVQLREHRLSLVRDYLSGPLSRWLNEVPVAGGSSMERLEMILTRLPKTIKTIAESPPFILNKDLQPSQAKAS